MDEFNIYKDIQARTGGEIYIGVVGPVRTGKSTFIRRFMELFILPNMDAYEKERAIDEMPISGKGKMITTVEPKFIPKEAVEISLGNDTTAKIRMIDCVGYVVEGSLGSRIENSEERLVKTPWFDYDIPFSKAAEIGTQKVINEHSTIGIVLTADGSFGEIERENYIPAEERTINEMKKIGKPFIVVLNSSRPYSNEVRELVKSIEEKYNVIAMPINCEQLKYDDITKIMEKVLSVFKVTKINFFIPKWVEILSSEHELKKDLILNVKNILNKVTIIKDAIISNFTTDSKFIKQFKINKINLEDGSIDSIVDFDEAYYYKILSDILGTQITSEYKFMSVLKQLAATQNEYSRVATAYDNVKIKGYGVVTPSKEDIQIEEPEIIKHGNKFGVKIKSYAPSIHLIKATIETEIAPIVGSEQQANDLINYIKENSQNNPDGIWETNIFGKSIKQLIDDGIYTKVNKMTDESQLKLQDTMQTIINDSNGGIICIII